MLSCGSFVYFVITVTVNETDDRLRNACADVVLIMSDCVDVINVQIKILKKTLKRKKTWTNKKLL